MTISLKRISVAFIATLITVVQVNADDCKPVCQPACNPAPCCQPTCCPSPYCGPNCLPAPYCREFNFKGELLFWRPELCGLEGAFGDTTIATTVSPGVITTTVTETSKSPDYKWSPGFRVGGDMAFTCFDLEGAWTHYLGRAKFHDEGSYGRWKIRYDVIDLTFGRRWCVAPCFYFKPAIGLRGARIRQRLHSHLETFFTALIGDNTVYTDKDDREKFWGIGPELALDANWYMGHSLSLYGSVAVVSYYGTIRSENYDVDTFTSTVSVSDGKKRQGFNKIGTDAAIGIRWDKSWTYCTYDFLFMLKLGLEQHRIYDFSKLGSDGTLSLDGGIFGAGVGFRY